MSMASMFGGADRKNSQHLRFEEYVPPSGWTQDSESYCLIIDLPGFKRDQVKLQVDDYGHLVASGERQENEYKHILFQQSYKVPENSNVDDTTAKFEDEILYIVIPKKITAKKEPQHEITNFPQAVEEEKETTHNAMDKAPEPSVQEEKEKDKYQSSDADTEGGHKQESGSSHHSYEETSREEKEHGDDKEEEQEEEVDEKKEFRDKEMEKERNEVSLIGELAKQLKKNKGILFTAVLAFSVGVWVSQKFQQNEK